MYISLLTFDSANKFIREITLFVFLSARRWCCRAAASCSSEAFLRGCIYIYIYIISFYFKFFMSSFTLTERLKDWTQVQTLKKHNRNRNTQESSMSSGGEQWRHATSYTSLPCSEVHLTSCLILFALGGADRWLHVALWYDHMHLLPPNCPCRLQTWLNLLLTYAFTVSFI